MHKLLYYENTASGSGKTTFAFQILSFTSIIMIIGEIKKRRKIKIKKRVEEDFTNKEKNENILIEHDLVFFNNKYGYNRDIIIKY